MINEPITIILPVYGRQGMLEQALGSVLSQKCSDWKLIIADDGSDEQTKEMLKEWIYKRKDARVRLVERENNLGLFRNLNKAIEESETEWIVILCSDDILEATAVQRLLEIREKMQVDSLILSTFTSIDSKGMNISGSSKWHHDQISRVSRFISPSEFVPMLLKLGSLNGNITGMSFSKTLWTDTGGFREDWRHAADWEWIVRATEDNGVILNRIPIAKIRTHDGQLSNENRRNGSEIREVAEVVKCLKGHYLMRKARDRKKWACHIMQFQLWNVLKGIRRYSLIELIQVLVKIEDSAGLIPTVAAMVRFIPKRI